MARELAHAAKSLAKARKLASGDIEDAVAQQNRSLLLESVKLMAVVVTTMRGIRGPLKAKPAKSAEAKPGTNGSGPAFWSGLVGSPGGQRGGAEGSGGVLADGALPVDSPEGRDAKAS